MIILKDLQQGTPEWHQSKLGIVSGTRLKSLMGSMTTQAGLGAMDRILFEIIAERDTGLSKDSIGKSEAMERGNIEEENTQDYFEITTGKKVTNVGFIRSEDFEMLGLSPDGVIFDKDEVIREAVEYKNPNSDTHLKYHLYKLGIPTYSDLSKNFSEDIPDDYYWQVVNYFLVIDTLERLHFIYHDERSNFTKSITTIIERKQIQHDVDLARLRMTVFESKVKEIEKKLVFKD